MNLSPESVKKTLLNKVKGLYFMDFLKLIVFSTLIRYLYRCNIFPVSKISVPFGSVTIYDVGKSFDVHCMPFNYTHIVTEKERCRSNPGIGGIYVRSNFRRYYRKSV